MMKPASCPQMKVSQPTPSETIQIRTVLLVSIVERWAEEANLVTDTPRALNEPIEKMIRIPQIRSSLCSLNYWNASIESSRYPSWQMLEWQSLTCWKIGSKIIQNKQPHIPSIPTKKNGSSS